MKHPILLKLDDETHARWTSAAKIAGKTLSGWIRENCDAAIQPRDAGLRALASSAEVMNTLKPAVKARRSSRSKAYPRTAAEIVAPSRSGREMVDVRMAPAAEGQCAHGKRAGEVCYRCDERMGFPSLPLTRGA